MRRLLLLASLVALAAGCGGTSSEHRRPSEVQRWIELEHLPQQAISGAELFDAPRCLACHEYAGSGQSNLGAPDLTSIGSRDLGIRFEIAHLKCPSCVNKGSPMPPFTSLGAKRLHELAVFLEASKGIH